MSRYGVVTGSYYHDTVGPLARNMKDVAILLDIMKGVDRHDNLTFEAAGHYPKDSYASQVVGKDALRGLKLGVPWEAYWASNGVRSTPACCSSSPMNSPLFHRDADERSWSPFLCIACQFSRQS